MPNVRQIAKMADVSVSTVSRVLNGHPYVSEEKRKAVLDAVGRLNYTKNMNAVHLLKGKTNMAGVILPFVNHPYFSRLLEGISGEALKADYRLILCQTNYERERELRALELLKEKQIDGVIICSRTLGWEDIAPYCATGPVVACEKSGHPAISSVYIDHYASFEYGIRHLIAKGHRRIGYCTSRVNSSNSEIRRRAFRDTLHRAQIPVTESWMFHDCFDMEDGVEVARKLMELEERPTALLVTGDQVAAGIMAEAGRQGLVIPDDLAIIGFDNHPISRVLRITTIDNRLDETGSRAFRLLVDRITGSRNQADGIELPFRLISRSTV